MYTGIEATHGAALICKPFVIFYIGLQISLGAGERESSTAKNICYSYIQFTLT